MDERVVVRRQIGRKGSTARTWLVIGGDGQREEMEAGKQVIMRRTGLAARDLRILDPLLSHPSAIMGRERAMVINLEHVKAIITAQQVFLLNARDLSVIPFVDELHARILHHHHACTQSLSTHSQGGGDGESEAEIKEDSREDNSMKILPFEFVALEACVESVYSTLENETQTLVQDAHSALDKLTSKISTLNLEYVRQIKSRLVDLTARAQRVRDEIENLLDDDDDMAELFLTDKLAQHQYPNSSASSINSANDVENLHAPQPDINDRAPEISLERGGDSTSDHEDEQNGADEYSSGQIFGAGSEIYESQAGNTNSAAVSNKNRNVEDLEILLGAYFVQIGGTINKLSALGEYVGDTEDYININLDDKQNRILEAGVKIGTASVLLNAFIVVTGVFGINIRIELFNTGLPQFLAVTFGCTAACIFLYAVAMAWYKHKRLLE